MAREKLNLRTDGKAPRNRVNRFRGAVVTPVMAALVAWGAGTGHIAPAPAEAGPVIRADGLVEVLRPDGTLAASLAVEIAETPEARARGLMERVLSDYMAGMLFLFASAEPQTFWMRNTPSSLDMIFIDAAGRVLNVVAYTTPMSDQLYSSAGPAKYVVEAKAGFADRFGIRPGYVMRWKRVR
jgi:uncharacterized membrane protein (UPF0127 family)